MTDKERITRLEEEIVKLRDIIRGSGNTNELVTKTMDYRGKVDFKNKVAMRDNVYIKNVSDIALTTIDDTSTTNQSANITENFNKIIGALNDE